MVFLGDDRLDQIKLEYNQRRPNGRLKLTVHRL